MSDVRLAMFFADGNRVPAPEGPGWYLYSTDNGEEVVPKVRIPNDEATKLAKVIDKFIEGKPLHWQQNVTRSKYQSYEAAVIAVNDEAKELIRRELAEAERAIQNLEILKQRAKEFGVDADN